MDGRVHPTNPQPERAEPNPKESDPAQPNSNLPKSGTYVIQIPKDQIYRFPPPQNAHLFENYSRRSSSRRRSPCFRCLAYTFILILSLLVLLTITAAVLYFVLQPKFPSYSLDKISISGFNDNIKSGNTLSPQFNITIRAHNKNKKIELEYREGSNIVAAYRDLNLCRGSWPVFRQGTRNVTVFETQLKGSGIRVSGAMRREMEEEERDERVPVAVDVKVPVRVRVRRVRSWTFTVKVECDVVLDKLGRGAKIVSKSCKTRVKIW